MLSRRREVLKAGLAAALFAPLPHAWVWAQSDGALRLLKAPKVALVVGNGKYKDAPELKNAPNDAKAMAETLRGAGFAVTLLLDASKDALGGAIRDYVQAMEKHKAVGLFYFAGHGAQLEWRNYMLPVDAVIDTVEDLGRHSVDVTRLLEGLTKAANPMNVIILDACREDPFGKARKLAQKGLSQMDAPINTILAYATSPGNVASDGDGANGLYTEHLLREMRVPEAKIEDVFKRVRLGVRRTSNGAQVPWESTSLEEDFWFIPPKALNKLTDAERERLFREERESWKLAESASQPGPVEAYLRRYPNGEFSELAQLRLDRILARQGEKKIEMVKAEGNPFTKGAADANTAFKVGDRYELRVLEAISRVETSRISHSIVQVTDDEVVFSDGLTTDLLGNPRRYADGRQLSGVQNVPADYAVGKSWKTRFDFVTEKGQKGVVTLDFRIVARESVVLPAGTFNAFRIEGRGYSVGEWGSSEYRVDIWRDPDRLRAELIFDERSFLRGRTIRATRKELVTYREE